MYKTNFVCTYKLFEDLADDEVNSDMLYQAQFLQVFGLTDYNDSAINASLELIKAKASDVPELKALILQHPYNTTITTNDSLNVNVDVDKTLDMLLPLMFAYPLLDVFHLCLISVFKTGNVSAETQEKVLRAYEMLK